MNIQIWRLKQFMKYYQKAKTIYQIHSPFIYAMLAQMNGSSDAQTRRIEGIRSQLLADTSSIDVEDFGASHRSNYQARVGSIAKKALSKSYQCMDMYQLVKFLNPKVVWELGTSFGISTAYLACGAPEGVVHTFEGSKAIGKIAAKNFDRLALDNISLQIGAFEHTVIQKLQKINKIDLAFLDGNHTEDATLQYFRELQPKLHNDSVLIIDDIYWSPGMQNAWQKIINLSAVTLAIDRFDYGLIFFNNSFEEKQIICSINQRFKPWSIGLFG